MFKRIELHNHTIHSDGKLSPFQLAKYLHDDGVDCFAITDHNTTSTHVHLTNIIADNPNFPKLIYGLEYTTYYGHILCYDVKKYVSWENIDKNNGDKLFKELKDTCEIVGIAHPFVIGAPFGTCRFELKISDYSCINFIEVFNNSADLHFANKPALAWWVIKLL